MRTSPIDALPRMAGQAMLVGGCLILALCISRPAIAQTFTDPGFVAETVTSLSPFTPVGLVWAPDGRMFIWTKNGVVRVFKNGVLLSTPFINLSAEVNTFDDRGMWGVAFHPDFANNGYVYLSYTYENAGNPNDSSPKTSRLVRVTANPANPDVALAGSYTVILGSIGIPPCSNYPEGSDCIGADGGSHTIGTIRFAPDGKLLVGIGDGSDGDALSLRAQDLDDWPGKIFRMNADGTAPGDNPFDDGTNSIRSKVWIYGVRNPFRYSVNASRGELYFGDVGWNTFEEVNRGVAGANFGWPCYEGNLPQSFFSNFAVCQALSPGSVTQPILTYDRSVGAAAIGGAIYTGEGYPAAYQGSYFFADYVGGWIRRVTFDASGNATGFPFFATNVAAPVTVELGPDGNLYYISFSTGQIRRIRFNGPSAVASASPSSGYSPLTVSFSSAGSVDPGGQQLTYLWNFGDGGTSTAPNPVHTYTAGGVTTFTASLTVRTQAGATSSATVKVTVGSLPPSATIQTPAGGTVVQPGQTIFYQGSATDPDEGALPPSSLTWTVLLHHNTHVHTFVGNSGSAEGSFVAEDHGIGSYSYEIVLTATDSSGLTGSTSVVLPVSTDTTPPTTPTNLSATAVSSSQIGLTWTASTDNGTVLGYQIERCSGAGCTNFSPLVTVSGTSHNDTGLLPASSYSYRVRATDSAGNLSGYSAAATATTQTGPPAGSGLVAAYGFEEASGTTVTDASGNGNTGTISGATRTTAGRYGSALSFDGINDLVAIAGSSSLNVSTGTTLEAWIFPTVAQSGWRTILQREVDAYFLNASNDTGPLRPSGGAMLNGAVNWISGPTANPVNAWTHVALTYDGTALRLYVNGTQVATGAASGLIQTNSSPLRIGGNVPYGEFFTGRIDEVRIYNRALTTQEIVVDRDTPIGGGGTTDTTPPTAPSTTTATATSATAIAVSWTASTDNVGVTGYQVERCSGTGCSNFAPLVTVSATSHNDTGLTASTTYRYRVRATDAAGNLGAYGPIATATTPGAADVTPPTIPSNLSASATSSSQINLTWTASTDNVGVTGYHVERCLGPGCSNFAALVTVSGTSHSDTGLSPSTSYSYRVRATDASGNLSGYSAAATATTPAGPPAGSGPVAAYAFEEASGTSVTDASGNGNTGTINGATRTTGGRYGSALSFDGVNDLVQIAGSASLNLSTGMTLEAWIFPTAAQSGWRTILQREVDAYFLNASNDTGPLRPSGGAMLNGAVSWISGPTANPVNAWTHVALTYDGAALRLYVNGTQVSTAAASGQIQTTSSPLRIGGNVPYGEFFTGVIDEVRIYNRALSAAEIVIDRDTPIDGGGPPPDTTPPTAPSTTTATASNATAIAVSWTASTDDVGVTGYQVERCSGTGCSNFAPLVSVSGTSHNDTGLTVSTTYRYRVRATDAAGNLGAYGPIATATTTSASDTTPPTAPSTTTATATSATVIGVSWAAATDNVGVTGYQLERCTGAGCTNFAALVIVSSTSHSDTGLTASTTYSYRVRATDAAGNLGGYGPIATATTLSAADTTPPTIPSNLSASATSSTAITVSWTASTDNVGVTGYQLERCLGPGCSNFAALVTVSGTSHSDTGLSPSTSYSYRLRAADASGNLSGYSPPATTTTQTGPPTGSGLVAAYAFEEASGTTAVTDASGNGNTGTINGATRTTGGRYGGALSFDGVNDLVAVAGSASLNVSTAMTLEAWIFPTAAQSGWRTILQREVDAYFLNASNDTGPLRPSGGAMLNGAVSWLSGPTANPVNAWTHVALTYDGAALRLYVNGTQVATAAASGLIQMNSSPLRIGGNVPYGEFFAGVIDEVRVYNRALSAAEIVIDRDTPIDGGGTPSDTTAPTAPSTTTATATSSTAVTVSWTASTDNVGVTGYQVERCSGIGCSNFAPLVTVTGTTHNDTGLTASTTYRYQVRAADGAGNVSAYSAIATVATPGGGDTTAPTAPGDLTATATSSTAIALSWTASIDNVGVNGYQLERCTGAGCTNFTPLVTVSGSTHNDTGLSASTTYRYRVRATDAAGNLGAYGPIATATTQGPADTSPPTVPSGLTATASSSTAIALSWSASTDNIGVTGYQVQKCTGNSCTNFATVATTIGTSYSDTGLTPRTRYRYRVRAVDAAGNLSGFSSIAQATTGR